jgi:hypothetical protein
MKVLMFQPRFAPLVEAGTKTQTIRPVRRRPIVVGDELSLRAWTGLPYRSPQQADEVIAEYLGEAASGPARVVCASYHTKW